jgi:hypothetical protein
MHWRSALNSPAFRRRVLTCVLAFAMADLAAMWVIEGIRSSSIGWSQTGFHGMKWRFSWGWDAVWFPVLLVLTALAFALPASRSRVLPRRRLIWCVGSFTMIRLLAAYSLWLNLAIIKPLVQRLGPRSGRWPPWGIPGLGTVVLLETLLLLLCVWVFAPRWQATREAAAARRPSRTSGMP